MKWKVHIGLVVVLVLCGCASSDQNEDAYERGGYERHKDSYSSGLDEDDLEYLAAAKTRDLMDLTTLIQDPDYPKEFKPDAMAQVRTLFAPDASICIDGDSSANLEILLGRIRDGELEIEVMESRLSTHNSLDSLETGEFSGKMKLNGEIHDMTLAFEIQEELMTIEEDTLLTRRMRFTRLELIGH